MIGLLDYVKNRIRQTGSLAGKDAALLLSARCAAVIRPAPFAAALSSCQGGLHPPVEIPRQWGVPAPSTAGLPLLVRLNGAFRIALAGNPPLSVTGQHRAAGAALIPLAGDSGLTLAGQPRASCAPGEA
jgi:hypothetical protein